MKREEVIYCLKAQSERYSEVCEECPLYGQTGVDHCCEDALQLAITALQNQPVWIPVSERLPEKSGSYLTWVRYDNEEFMSIEDIDCEGILKEWNFTGKVLYWMPLPEPYQGSESHKQTNADKIRAMSDEELAEFIVNLDNHFGEEYEGEQSCLSWLQKESEE